MTKPRRPRARLFRRIGLGVVATVVIAVTMWGVFRYVQIDAACRRIEALGGGIGVSTMGLGEPEEVWFSVAGRQALARDADVIEILERLPNIRRLVLSSTFISDKVLDSVATLGALQSLDLSQTSISDAGMGRLEALSGLQVLELEGTAVSDASIPSLSAMRQLRILSIKATPISDEGKEQLRRSLPTTRIYTDDWP